MPGPIPDDDGAPLRLLTYLSPGLPFALYQLLGRYLAGRLDRPVSVASAPEGSGSGPRQGTPNPFATGGADIGFVCAPSYRWLARAAEPTVELVGAAPCHDDPRNAGHPVYYAVIVARAALNLGSFEELAGRHVLFNDPSSLSGYHGLRDALAAKNQRPEEVFASFRESGSHHRSLELIARGHADAAAIDANVWRSVEPVAGVAPVCTLGPFPIQPVVIRRALSELRPPICQALLEMHERPEGNALRQFGIERFAPVSDADYAGRTNSGSGNGVRWR
ncbi:MAG: PhnD/SsuA/transferrin family substrate-binding protein [Myxococcota bacterium]